ncbi:MAG: hypothetical protein RL376_1207 [Verrucomicrobiota bacterium]|jgi:hypothetical protein
MFAPLTRFFLRRPDVSGAAPIVVEAVRVEHPRELRSRRSEWVLAIGWVLILAKSIAVYWLCDRYAVPVNPWWVIAPTLAFAGVCTGLYWRRF